MFLVGAGACQNADQFIDGLNQSPFIFLHTGVESGIMIADSIKLSGDAGLFFYPVGIKIEDVNGNIELISIDTVENRPSLLVQSDSILVDVKLVEHDSKKDSIVLQVAIFSTGTYTIDFTIIDSFSRRNSASLELEVFENLAPIVSYIIRTDELSDDVRIIDLSSSYDQDSRFGGQIVLYNFVINGQLTASTESELRHPFPGPGIYPVTVFVTDNNIENSSKISFNIEI